MHKKCLLIVFLPFLFLLTVPSVVQAATITACTFNKETYYPGQTGYITVTIHNYKEDKIRITELTATINYYYSDGNDYIQSFFTNETLPTEIQKGQSSTFYIPFSLPTNIAPGFTVLYVKAYTELWGSPSEGWMGSDHPTYHPTLHVESPYKQQSEDYEQEIEEYEQELEEYKQQLEEQQTINENTTTMMYLFVATTVAFAVVMVLLFVLNRRARVFTQPIA